jgi:hypothetical protein
MVRGRLILEMQLGAVASLEVATMLKIMGKKSPPPAVVAEFVKKTDGNPFFVEELFRHLAEENCLYDSAGRHRFDLRIQQLDVPHNVPRWLAGASRGSTRQRGGC